MATDERRFLNELEIEVEVELDIARSSQPAEGIGDNPAEWLFDPTDIERDEVGLRSILGAVDELETDTRFSGPGTTAGDELGG